MRPVICERELTQSSSWAKETNQFSVFIFLNLLPADVLFPLCSLHIKALLLFSFCFYLLILQ